MSQNKSHLFRAIRAGFCSHLFSLDVARVDGRAIVGPCAKTSQGDGEKVVDSLASTLSRQLVSKRAKVHRAFFVAGVISGRTSEVPSSSAVDILGLVTYKLYTLVVLLWFYCFSKYVGFVASLHFSICSYRFIFIFRNVSLYRSPNMPFLPHILPHCGPVRYVNK